MEEKRNRLAERRKQEAMSLESFQNQKDVGPSPRRIQKRDGPFPQRKVNQPLSVKVPNWWPMERFLLKLSFVWRAKHF